MRLCWDFSVPTRCKWVAYDCESQSDTAWYCLETGTPTDGDTWVQSHIASMLRMIVNGTPHLTSLIVRLQWATSLLRWDSADSLDAWVLLFCIIARPRWGNADLLHTYIDLSNFCHFLRNKDSRYCFFSCNRCSLRFNNGHLSTFRAYLIFLHRASKALSRAANSFMLVSWSRLLRNIHS